MPKDYEAIKQNYAKQHPSMSDKDVKKHAAMIAQSARKKAGKPSIKWSKYTSRES